MIKKLPINKIYQKDCVKGMRLLPAKKIDLIVTDPPFAINFKAKKANYNRTASKVIPGYKDIPEEEYADFTDAWMREAFRVLKDNGSMYVVSGYNHLATIRNSLEEAGFILNNEIIWKFQFGVVTKKKFVTSHYNISFVSKKKDYKFYPTNRFSNVDKTEKGGSARYADMEDVWIIPKEYWTGEIKTPTKLPIALISKMLGYSSVPGNVILDPFLGSGQVALASKQMKRKYIGYEIVKEYVDFARKRLSHRQK